MSKIIGIATVYDGLPLVPHFVSHYFKLGVDELRLNVNVHSKPDRLEEVRQATSAWPVHLAPVDHEFMGEKLKDHGERQVLDQCSSDGDWILHLDIDEFHEYPYRLRTVVEALEKKGTPLISTDLVDRFTADGSLPPIRDDVSIFSQFPIGSSMTRNWQESPFKKVMICRGWVRLEVGRHVATNAPVTGPAVGDWSRYRVHHFKWFNGIIERLMDRADHGLGMNSHYRERCRYVAHRLKLAQINPRSLPDYEYCGDMIYPTE